jgi:hypothetical protein
MNASRTSMRHAGSAPAEPQEEAMYPSPPKSDGADQDTARKLIQLQARLTQINALTGEALEVLRSLEPDLAQVSTVMAELDAMVNRWKAGDRKEHAA